MGGYTHVDPVGIVVSGSLSGNASGSGGGRQLLGTLFATENGTESTGFPSATNSISCQLSSSTFNISGSELGIAVSASVVPSSGSDISDVFGASPFGSKNAYVYNYFEQGATDATGYFVESGSKVEWP